MNIALPAAFKLWTRGHRKLPLDARRKPLGLDRECFRAFIRKSRALAGRQESTRAAGSHEGTSGQLTNPTRTRSVASRRNHESLELEQTDRTRFDSSPEVETFSLRHMDRGEVLATFENYKPHFDRLVDERKSMKETHSYMNVNHTEVQHVLSSSFCDKMIKKLEQYYYFHGNH